MKKPTQKWLKMAELYKRFATPWQDFCDFSDKAKQAMFNYESNGIGNLSVNIFAHNSIYNGYAVGKHWLNVTVAMWIEDLGKTLWLSELYNGTYPIEWLDNILKKYTDKYGMFHYSWLE